MSAVQRISTLTTSVFPLCLDQRRQRNLLGSNRTRCWYSVAVIPRIFFANSTGSATPSVCWRLSTSQPVSSRVRLRLLISRLVNPLHRILQDTHLLPQLIQLRIFQQTIVCLGQIGDSVDPFQPDLAGIRSPSSLPSGSCQHPTQGPGHLRPLTFPKRTHIQAGPSRPVYRPLRCTLRFDQNPNSPKHAMLCSESSRFRSRIVIRAILNCCTMFRPRISLFHTS